LSGPLNVAQKALALDMMITGDMPPNMAQGHTIPLQEITQFSAWLDQDQEAYRDLLRAHLKEGKVSGSTLIGR
jgi:hypothetical protein